MECNNRYKLAMMCIELANCVICMYIIIIIIKVLTVLSGYKLHLGDTQNQKKNQAFM